MKNNIIPRHTKGKYNDLDYSETFTDKDEACKCFVRAYKRMLNPNLWYKLCGPLSADFDLVGNIDDTNDRLAEVGDYFKINIPGPGAVSGDGYDWVRVEAIEQHLSAAGDEESAGMRVRPTSDPQKNTEDVAHFFTASSSSSFVIYRSGNTVTASYHGRNEQPNTDTTSTIDNVRNAVLASGALSGLSEMQWTALIRGFIKEEIGG